MQKVIQIGKSNLAGAPPIECTGIRKDGREFPIDLSLTAWRVDEEIFFGAIIRDISEKKRAEDALSKSEEKYRSIVETAREGICVFDTEGVLTFVNDRLAEMLGYEPKELTGRMVWEFAAEEQEKTASLVRVQGYKKGQIAQYEANLVKKDGSKIWTLANVAPIFDKKGNHAGNLSMHTDITGRKEAEDNLRQLSSDLEKFKLAIESAYDHIVITDKEGTILFANKAVERITGFSLAEIISQKPSLWGKQMPSGFYKRFWRTIKEYKKPFVGEIKNKRKNGALYAAEIKVSPVLDEQGQVKFFVGIERDVTEQKELDRAKTEFISLAAHQLRTPLTTISLTSEMLLKGIGGKIAKKSKQYLKDIFFEVKDMAEMIEVFLNVSRIEMGGFPIEPKPLKVFDVIERQISAINPQIKNKKITLQKDYAKSLPVLSLDKKVMEIVLENLLSNAVKYTNEGGRILVGAKEAAGGLLIEISDTGLGIPLNQRSQIFSKMFRADNVKKIKSEGSGLGLYVAKSLIDQAGGKIWFNSKEGEGASFYVSLPKRGMKRVSANI